MTPLLENLLKLPAATSLVKIERKEAQKMQDVYYVTEKVSSTEEVWEHEEVAEEHAEMLYEDRVVSLDDTTVSSTEINILSAIETMGPKAEKSELKGDISVTDTSKRKETRLVKHRIVPKTQETVVVVEETESDRDKVVRKRQDEPPKKIIEDTTVAAKKESKMIIKTEARQVGEQEVKKIKETVTVEEVELIKETPAVKEMDKTKRPPITISTEARKRTEEQEIKGEALREVMYEESTVHDIKITGAVPEEQHYRTERVTEVTEITVRDKPTHAPPAQVEIVEEEISRKAEALFKPPVDKPKAPVEVSVKTQKPAERKQEKKPDQIADKKKVPEKLKPKEDVTPKVRPKEPVTDIEPKSPVIDKESVTEIKPKRPVTDKESITDKESVTEIKPKSPVTDKESVTDIKPKSPVADKEPVTDIKPKRPEETKQQIRTEPVTGKKEMEYEKKVESKDILPQGVYPEVKTEETSLLIKETVQIKPSVPSKPEEKKRIPQQTVARGTKRKSNLLIIFIPTFLSDSITVHSFTLFASATRGHHFIVRLSSLLHVYK